MQLHGPKRVYTRDSLEFWFTKLERDWDGFFGGEDLASGRELYRTGGIREIELTAADAIVHIRIDKKDEYSVIEWGEAGLNVRCSSSDKALGNRIAVAGLHEIEELIADELGAMPLEAGHAGNGSQAATAPEPAPSAAVTPATNGAGRQPPAARAAPARKRELLLRFHMGPRGLLCEPWWSAPGAEPTPALASSAKGGAAAATSPMERMKLISLTAMAKKSHFHFHGDLGAYLLEQVAEIPHFLKVVLPTWARTFTVEQDATVERIKEGVRTVQVEARVRRAGGEGSAINLEWIFRTGEQLIDAAGVKALGESRGGPVVLENIGMVALSPEGALSLAQWREATAALDPKRLPAYLLFSLFNDQRLALTLTPELEAWRTRLLESRPERMELPAFLRPYQRRGVEWLAHLCTHGCHGLLADEMGLGKTLQIATLLAARPLPGMRHLIVCPASVVPVWREEVRRFFPELRLLVLRNGHDFRNEGTDGIWLASYAQLRNHRALLEKFKFGYAVLDEGQFIKNPDAKVTNTCFEIRAKHRIVLTGTPLENRQLDLWSILNFLSPGLLGTRASFEAAILRDHDGTLERLRRQIAPFVLRRTKAEVATELPPKVEIDLLCPLSPLQRQEYGRVCREGLQRLGDDIGRAIREKAFGFLSLLTRLRQICCDPDLLPWLSADTAASGKLELLVERLGEVISSGHKVVIFSQFVMFLKRVEGVLAKEFPDIPRFELTGSTIDRQKPVSDFQNCATPAFMVVSLKAAGTGITLHAADYVFLLDPWWNPSVEDQAVDRVHRIGQTRTVFVYRMITAGTIEERIQALKAEKKQLFRQVIDGVGGDFDFTEHFNSLHQLIQLAGETPESGDGPAAETDVRAG